MFYMSFQVTCQSFYEVPPLMGMILTSVSVVLSQGFRHHRMHLGFNTGCHVSRDILPECTVVLDTVVNIVVMDWWHPKYPHFDNRLPSKFTESDESLPVLKNDFFTTHEEDLQMYKTVCDKVIYFLTVDLLEVGILFSPQLIRNYLVCSSRFQIIYKQIEIFAGFCRNQII